MSMGTSSALAGADPTRPMRASSADPGDGPLVERLRAGDEAAFLALLRRHQTPMLRMARIYVSSQATAEDVVQETWLAVLRGVDGFQGRSSLETWMYRILTNRAKTASQRERRCHPDSASAPSHMEVPEARADRWLDGGDGEWRRDPRHPPPTWAPSVEDALVRSEEVALVCSAINLLPPLQRLVITLRDVERWTAAEVCDALELSPTNQRVLLHRARSKVRKRFGTDRRGSSTEKALGGRHGPGAAS